MPEEWLVIFMDSMTGGRQCLFYIEEPGNYSQDHFGIIIPYDMIGLLDA